MVTGSIPTENLPKKPLDKPTKVRRTLVRNTAEVPDASMPSASSGLMSESPFERPSIEDFQSQLNNEAVLPWTVDITRENEVIKFQLHDGGHSIAKYTVILNTALEFSVFVFNWPVPDDHAIYNERKRRVCDLGDWKILLKSVEGSKICDGLPQDFVTQSVVVDPTSDVDFSNFPDSTVLRHSAPRSLSEENFQTSVTFRSPNCEVIQLRNILTDTDKPCDPCSKTFSLLDKAAKRKKKTTAAPAKSKAPLSSCSSEKLVAAVKASRLECKQLEGRIKELESKIKNHGVEISGTLENDILKIMSSQNPPT